MKPTTLFYASLPLLSTTTATPFAPTTTLTTPAFCTSTLIYPSAPSTKGSFERLYNGTGHREPKHNTTTTVHTLLAKNLTDGCEALVECAGVAYDEGFFNFELLYTRSKGRYSCVSYGFLSFYEQGFTVRDRDVMVGYGFQSTAG